MIICILAVTGCRNTNDTGPMTKDIVKVDGFENTEYNLETDYQYCFSDYIELVLVEGGYYIVNMNILYFYDKASMKVMPVCSKIDCNHKNEECDAYVGDIFYLSYYEQGLYYIVYESSFVDDTASYMLYRRTLDGSVAEKLCNLATVTKGSSAILGMIAHRGYIYYSLMESDIKCTLFRVPIDGKGDVETLYTVEGYDPYAYKLKGYGDGITFISSVALDSEYSEFEYSLYYYDSNENAVKSVMEEGLVGEYLIHDNKIYYTLPDGVYCYDVIQDKDEKFYETDSLVYMSFDGNYFYFDNLFGISMGTVNEDSRNILVVSSEGEIVDTIDFEELYMCAFGDRDYMFRSVSDGYILLDKDQIGTGNHEWTELPIRN